MRPLAFLFLIAAIGAEPRINQIQVLGSHNSYKLPIEDSLLAVLRADMGDRIAGLEYGHLPMSRQLDLGLRSLEIDVVHDPEGGRYAKPRGLDLASGSAYDSEGVMKRPGLKVLHVPDIDFRSSAYTLQQALGELKRWSDAHPRHLPIVVTMNAKDSGVKKPGYTEVLPFDRAAFDAWDRELLSGLGRGKLITPDDVRGDYPTLERAVLAHAWPTIERSRGKFLFVLDETEAKRKIYTNGHPSLKGRVMFVDAPEGEAEAAVRVVNEPVQNGEYIRYLVLSGYLVRTRADADTREARTGDYKRWHAALQSGAQVISTDYYVPDPRLKSNYRVALPGGQAGRWNVLLLPEARPLPALE